METGGLDTEGNEDEESVDNIMDNNMDNTEDNTIDESIAVDREMARTWRVEEDSFTNPQAIKNTNFRAIKYGEGDGEGTKYICNICSNEFSQIGNVKRHITKQHVKKKEEPKEQTELQDMTSGKRKQRESPGLEEKEEKRQKAVKDKFDMERVKRFLDNTPGVTSTQMTTEETGEDVLDITNDVEAAEESEVVKKVKAECDEKVARMMDEAKIKEAKIQSLEEAITTNRNVSIVREAEKQNLQIYVTEKEKELNMFQAAFDKMEKEREALKKGKSSKDTED